MALPRHHTAERHQRRGAEPILLGAERRGDGDVAAGLETAIGLQHDPAAQAGAGQGVMRFGQADFPGHAGVLD